MPYVKWVDYMTCTKCEKFLEAHNKIHIRNRAALMRCRGCRKLIEELKPRHSINTLQYRQ